MAEYIERFSTIDDALSVSIVTDDLFGLGFQAGVDAVVRKIANRPTADVVEVVRCKDCVYKHLTGKPPFMSYICTIAEGLNVCKNDSFCSYGERREEDAVD